MQLRDNDKAQNLIRAMLTEAYGKRITPGQIQIILDRVAKYDSEDATSAVYYHIDNATHDGDGDPVGGWPPAPAHIIAQLQQIARAKIHAEQDRRNRERSQESDATFVQAHATDSWKDQIAMAKQIRMGLVHRYSLDLKKPEDMGFVMQVLGEVERIHNGMCEAPIALKTAERLR